MKRSKQFKTFRALNLRDKLSLLKITVIVAAIEIGLRFVGFKKVAFWLNRFSRKANTPQNVDVTIEQHKKLIFLVSRIFPFVGRCLARSLTIWWLLRRRGIETDLKIGMQKKNGAMLGHAWVEYQKNPLVYDPNVARKYVVFDDLLLTNIIEADHQIAI